MEGKTERNRITTVVVEDEEKIRDFICAKIVSLDDDFEIVGRAGNGREAMELIQALRPQVVFTDICMPVMGGMELIKEVRQLNPKTIVVILSGYSDFTYAQQAIRYGVMNYLLKPIEDDMLLEQLFDIKKSLSYSSVKKQRNIVYSRGYQLISENQEAFALAVVCLGNVIYSMQDEEVIRFYTEKMEQIFWNGIMEKQFGGSSWFVADDHVMNQKIIAVKADLKNSVESSELAKRLQRAIGEETDLSINLCCARQPVAQKDLWNEVKQMRDIIKKRLIIGESNVFYMEDREEPGNHMLEIIKMKLNTYVKNYFISTDLDNFMDEIRVVFKYMKNNHAPQESIEKICVYVLHLLEFSNQGYEREQLDELQSRMLQNISLETSEEALFESLIQLFGTINSAGDEEKEIEKIRAYIDEHYLTIESMEEVADEFGYNYTYLSRMFKNKAGESMSRYILNKKLDLAKEMLRTRTELKVTEISDLCGYNDYRYFGRVFKNEVGVSPSEYRDGMMQQF